MSMTIHTHAVDFMEDMYEMYDMRGNPEQIIAEGQEPIQLGSVDHRDFFQVFWIAIREERLTLLIESVAEDILDRWDAEAIDDWFWLDEVQTRRFLNIVLAPGERHKMSPVLLISDSEKWKSITIKLHKILRDNEIKYTFERRMVVFDEQ